MNMCIYTRTVCIHTCMYLPPSCNVHCFKIYLITCCSYQLQESVKQL